MGELLSFRRMITPAVIQILFWLFVAVAVFGGLALLIGGDTGGQRVFGLIYLIIGPILARVYCEIIIILFRIHDVLREIRAGLAPGQPGALGQAGTTSPTPPTIS